MQLSPSSFGEFSACQRKYFYRKVLKLPNDPDYEEDNEAFKVGKAFHKVLEVRKHELSGLPLKEVAEAAISEGVEDADTWYMLYAMLQAYHHVFKKVGLTVAAVELEIGSPTFMGFVDVVLKDDNGNWWIGDMKTVGTWSDSTLQTLPSHPQLNLYSAHYDLIAHACELKPSNFQGVAYLATTKSRLKKKAKETVEEYIDRLKESVRSIWVFISKDKLLVKEVTESHAAAVSHISANLAEEREVFYSRNFGNCMAYFRPCQFYSKCHTRLFSEELGMRVETSDV